MHFSLTNNLKNVVMDDGQSGTFHYIDINAVLTKKEKVLETDELSDVCIKNGNTNINILDPLTNQKEDFVLKNEVKQDYDEQYNTILPDYNKKADIMFDKKSQFLIASLKSMEDKSFIKPEKVYGDSKQDYDEQYNTILPDYNKKADIMFNKKSEFLIASLKSTEDKSFIKPEKVYGDAKQLKETIIEENVGVNTLTPVVRITRLPEIENLINSNTYSLTKKMVSIPVNDISNQQKILLSRQAPYCCSICNKFYSSKSNLNRHRHSHSNNKRFICDPCGKCFKEKISLILHQRIHMDNKPFPCDICGKSFMISASLREHKAIHSTDKFKCHVCSKILCHKRVLLQHYQRLHCEIKPFVCNLCNKTFSDKILLGRHQRWHLKVKQFVCTVCNKSFKRKQNLLCHQYTHSNEKPFPCNICNRSFRRKHHLTTHKLLHSGERPFECNICGKSFSQKGNLQLHKNLHLENKPFVCFTCKKSFPRKAQLVNHQYVHFGNKPYSCSTCKKAFVTRSELNIHKRKHLGINPFKCETCKKSFFRKIVLTRHQRTHLLKTTCNICKRSYIAVDGHKSCFVSKLTCDTCKKTFRSKRNLIKHQRLHLISE